MRALFKHFWVRVFLGGVAGWLLLVALFAAYLFLLPHAENFAVPLGPEGTFVIFGCVFSAGYLALFLLVAIILALHRLSVRFSDERPSTPNPALQRTGRGERHKQ